MDSFPSLLPDKVAFFERVGACRQEDDHDQVHDREGSARAKSRAFFRKTSDQDASGKRKEEDSHRHRFEARQMPPSRRAISDPIAWSQDQVINTTPLNKQATAAPGGRLGSLLNGVGDVSVVRETPRIPETARPTGQRPLRRSDSSPLPQAHKRRISKEGNDLEPNTNGTAGQKKKRKRDAEVKLRPEAECIFTGLSFFYIPDNDIAPARRLRITKAREYGAAWIRNVADATHVVVDRGITFHDVQGVLKQAHVTPGSRPKVVNEDYPIDCIQFHALLDPDQSRYRIEGQEQEEVAIVPAPAQATARADLPLKPPQNNPKRWDYVPPPGTPSRSGESSENRESRNPEATHSLPAVLDLGEDSDAPPGGVARSSPSLPIEILRQEQSQPSGSSNCPEDQLSDYIDLMQKYKDLPLDHDEEDTKSTAGAADPASSDSEGQSDQQAKKRYRSSHKGIAFEDRFACNSAGTKGSRDSNPNDRTIEILQSMCDYYDRVNDHWRTTAYRKAIHTLKRQDLKIATEEQAFKLPNVGRRLAQKIEEIVTTDRLQRLEYAQDEPATEVLQLFLGIYGVGTKQAQQWIAQGYRSLDDLKQHAKLSKNQLIGIDHYDDINTRIPRSEVQALGEFVKKAAAQTDPTVQLIIGGSYRRGAESSSDIDLIVTKPGTADGMALRKFLNDLVQRLEKADFLVARLASSGSAPGDSGSKWHGCCVLPSKASKPIWRRIDFLLVPESEIGAALIYFTGDDIFNRSMRLLAQKKGMRLNQRGLWNRPLGIETGTEGELVEGRDERRIFEVLGVKWREPHERWCR